MRSPGVPGCIDRDAAFCVRSPLQAGAPPGRPFFNFPNLSFIPKVMRMA